jgi:peptide/nickel transport system substrate-binding protein
MTAVAFLAVGSLALTGCGQKNQSSGSSSAGASAKAASLPLAQINEKPRDQVKDGGTLRFGISLLPAAWNGLNVENNNVDLNSTIWWYVGVENFMYKADGTPVPNKDFLQSYDVKKASDNGGHQQVTLHLNPNAKWNSGRQIDYTDYVATWKANNGTNPAFKPATTDGFNQVTSITKGDKPTDVVITFKTSYPDWTSPFSVILPKEGASTPAAFNDGWKNFNPNWFAGPFTLDKIDKAQKTLTVKRNDKWWGDKSKLDSVSFKELDDATMTKAFANKEIDVVDTIITKDGYDTAKKRTDGQLREAGSLQWRHFTFNTKSQNLTDIKVRQAIVKGINREAIAKSDLAGLPVDPASVMLGNHFFMPGQVGYQDNAGPDSYNPEQAKKDLDAAGWKLNGSVREKDGKPLTIDYAMLTGVPTSENEGSLLKQNMASIGVKVNLVNTPADSMNDVLTNHSFGIIAFTWQGTPYPMNNVRQIYGAAAEGSNKPSESNYSQLVDPRLEKLIAQIDTEEDPAKRRDLTNQADKIIWDNVMTLPQYQRVQLTAVPANLANYGASTFQASTFKAEDVGYQK